MFPTGTIAGRITQRNGEPVVRASVQAFQYEYQDGKRTLMPVRSAVTNDLGEYRIFWLNPGQYFVAATLGTGRSMYLGVEPPVASSPAPQPMIFYDAVSGTVIRRLLDDGTFQEETWIPIYYPATAEARDATPIEVSSGATMNAVNIVIGPTPTRKISGQVIVPAGVNVRVTLAEMGSSGGFWRTTAGPSFEFKGIRPGSYGIFAEDGRNYVSPVTPIEVGNRDVDNIRIGLRPKLTLTGRVTFDGAAAQEQNPYAGLMITLTQGSIELPMSSFVPDPVTGSFVVNNVSPGDYQLLVRSTQENGIASAIASQLSALEFRPLPQAGSSPDIAGVWVKSVRLGQTDASNGISIPESTQDRLEIVITKDTGSLEGTVTEPGRAGAANATVVLVPAVARKNTGLYKATVADSAGKFRFQGIVAGDYLVFAWNDVERGAWQNPDFMRPFEGRGRRVQISAKDQQNIEIPVMTQ
jgi:hypothetical protein